MTAFVRVVFGKAYIANLPNYRYYDGEKNKPIVTPRKDH